MKLSIAMVSHDMVPIAFAYDLASLMLYVGSNLPDGVEAGINLVSGTYVHAARQQLLESLIAQECTHILWIDTDMRFPRDALFRLLQHDKEVVGINYSNRGIPAGFVAIKTVGNDETIGCKLETTEESTGIEAVDALGFGLVLMKATALRNLPKDGRPWFWFDWLEKRKQMIGEDVYFCNLLRESGVQLYVDHDLSKQCKHIGSFEYSLESVLACREAVAA